MKKLLIQGLLVFALFAGIWWGLSRVNWMHLFGVERLEDDLEKKIGKLIYESLDETEKIVKDPKITRPIDSIFHKLCEANDIDTATVKIHIIEKDVINAFAVPGDHLFVYTGLINETEKQEELIGVVGHEIAHIQLNHVMQKLVSEVGLAAIISMTSGGGSAAAAQLVQLVSSSAFSRKLEKEADLQGVDYMVNARVNPQGLADFMYKMATKGSSLPNLTWLNSHPDSKERAAYIVDYSKDKVKKPQDLIPDSSWLQLKEEVKTLEE